MNDGNDQLMDVVEVEAEAEQPRPRKGRSSKGLGRGKERPRPRQRLRARGSASSFFILYFIHTPCVNYLTIKLSIKQAIRLQLPKYVGTVASHRIAQVVNKQTALRD